MIGSIRSAAIGLLLGPAIGLAAAARAPGDSSFRRSESARIERLVAEAEGLRYREGFAPALALAREALGASRSLGDSRAEAICLDLEGGIRDFQGENAEGSRGHAQALDIARSIGDTRLEARILSHTGSGLWRVGAYEQALERLSLALRMQSDAGDDAGRAETLAAVGRVRFKRAEYEAALAAHRAALEIRLREGDARAESISREDLGDTLQEQGSYAAALTEYERAVDARRRAGDSAGEAYALHLVGRCILLQGGTRESLSWFERALALARRVGDAPSRALALYHLGIAHARLGDSAAALAAYGEGLEAKRGLGDPRQEAWILSRMADIHRFREEPRLAIARYAEAIGIWERVEDPRGLAGGLERMARVLSEQGDRVPALAAWERAAALREATQPAFLPVALAGAARTMAELGDHAGALERARRAASLAERGESNLEVQWLVLHELGAIERAAGLREEALASFRSSIGRIERLRAQTAAADEVRIGFLENKQTVYADTIDLLTELGREAEALEVAEQARSRALLDLMGNRWNRKTPGGSSRDRRRGGTAGEKPAGATTQADRATGERLIERGSAAPVSSGPAVPVPPGAALQAAGPERLLAEARRRDMTVVEYFSSADRAFVWVVGPNGSIHAHRIEISRRDLARRITRMRRAVREVSPFESPSGGDAHARRLERLLADLHRILVAPIEAHLPRDAESLVAVVPHGPLFLVSFGALLDASGRPLLERHTLVYEPSIRALIEGSLREPAVRRARLLAIGNPSMPRLPGEKARLPALPEADAEARAIASLFPEGATMLSGEGASEKRVRALAARREIVHFATHALLFETEPLSSFLALAPRESGHGRPEAGSDGRLTVREILELPLRADLVTLSACDTGLGSINGDGVQGLSRAFLGAGARTVLVSLWRLADTVAAFEMKRFYEQLRQTANKSISLRRAQLETARALREGRLRTPSGRRLVETPALWAPFVLVGEPR